MAETQAQNPMKINMAVIAIVAVLAIGYFLFSSGALSNLFPTSSPQTPTDITKDSEPTLTEEASTIGGFPALRSQYFREAFQPNREDYKIFENAAKHFNMSVEAYEDYANKQLGVSSEADIFANLPPLPEDFGETAYELANGKFFDIGLLEEEYYLQPELYPGFKTTGLTSFTSFDPNYWAPNGYGTYPQKQETVLTIGERESFTAVLFVYSSWLVQTYQGVTLVPTSNTLNYFDMTITPQNFLIGPSWPKFDSEWAEKVIITGKLKPGVEPGIYKIGLNVAIPPAELQSTWEREHRNIYFNAAGSIGPSGNAMDMTITVKNKGSQ